MKSLVLIVAASSMAFASVASAATTHHTKAKPAEPAATGQKSRMGTLSCEVAGGVGMIIGSSKAVQCDFIKSSGPRERYVGSIGKFGVDIGVTQKSYLRWVVYNLSANRAGEGALAGSYVGATAGASVGVGLGANALIGGTAKNFGLQPLSGEATKGLNVAAGVTQLQLRPAK
ncbi:DUF992 domain-containing protein [Rhizobium sp. BK376]|jgi:hypothetical protein|uniref:DUF992 domain-containing protein n=1 Tax=Rhizobium sp. BK376 TaxID=2512149 RepID=UPI00104EC720|nr:DUF992 domain-containing protein [Rhizobium sp. BK376]TCR93436.1 uncharacterized protein DUF992 [Rhizobium sp. BK376]